MAFLSRSHLLGLLLLVALPPEGTAALAVAAARASAPPPLEHPASLEERLRRIEATVRERNPGAAIEADDEGAAPQPADTELAFTFVNGPGLGWGNGGFRNGGFYNGGFRNGGFANGGGFRNGGWRNGGGGWRNGGFRNHW
ncbi:MAG: GrrA/OscA1 family cyclophane-containing rSAM-modified RiPP [Synechococcaceae cyanobacterium]